MSPLSRALAGYCPMGCGATLFLDEDGHITCSYLECPDPTFVDTLLADRETAHIVEFDDKGFTVQHPLRERGHGHLFECSVHADLRALGGAPVAPGRYRVTRHQPDGYSESYRSGTGGFDFERLEPS